MIGVRQSPLPASDQKKGWNENIFKENGLKLRTMSILWKTDWGKEQRMIGQTELD